MFLHSPEDYKKVEPILKVFNNLKLDIKGSMNYIIAYKLFDLNHLFVVRLQANTSVIFPSEFVIEDVLYEDEKVIDLKVRQFQLKQILSQEVKQFNGFYFELTHLEVEPTEVYNWEDYNSRMMKTAILQQSESNERKPTIVISMLDKHIIEQILIKKKVLKEHSKGPFKKVAFQKAKLCIDFLMEESKKYLNIKGDL